MKKWIESFFGLSLAAVVRGLRLGPREMHRAARRGFATAAPFENDASLHLSMIPVATLDEVVTTHRALINLPVMAYEDGMMPLRDVLALLAILVIEQPKAVLEIGTYMCHTTRALAENLPHAVVHTIDLPPDQTYSPQQVDSLPKDDFHLIARRRVGREFAGTVFAERIVQHFGDTAEFDFSQIGSPSSFVIDGSHTYEYCKSDSDKCLEIAAPNSIFLWHDCDASHPGVVRFLNEWREMGRNIMRVDATALAFWRSE